MQATATYRTYERERERELMSFKIMHNNAIAQNQRSTKLPVLIMLQEQQPAID
jgi:hypothetical protein